MKKNVQNFDGKSILITGGTGSFGKSCVKTILDNYNPKKIIIFSRDELKQYEMQFKWPVNEVMRYFIGDVRDFQRLKIAMKGVDVVIHAAALKHVSVAEYNPFEAIKTNVLGAQNIILAAMESSVTRVIAVSTDKAAAPNNLYGATKLASDKLFVAANNFKGNDDLKFSVVRYGNVFGSRGSVIPFFLKERKKGSLPITDPRMTRFNITIEQGVNFVFNCLKSMWGGEIFVPKLPSYKITDLAKAVDPNCEIRIIGIRPGEKIHEEMITSTDALSCIEFKNYYVILPSLPCWDVEKFRKTSDASPGFFCKDESSYNSGNNKEFLSIEQLEKLIKDFKLI